MRERREKVVTTCIADRKLLCERHEFVDSCAGVLGPWILEITATVMRMEKLQPVLCPAWFQSPDGRCRAVSSDDCVDATLRIAP